MKRTYLYHIKKNQINTEMSIQHLLQMNKIVTKKYMDYNIVTSIIFLFPENVHVIFWFLVKLWDFFLIRV
jgi:hypothetical protein